MLSFLKKPRASTYEDARRSGTHPPAVGCCGGGLGHRAGSADQEHRSEPGVAVAEHDESPVSHGATADRGSDHPHA